MKFSVITTVLNEEAALPLLLDALSKQLLLPTEQVIVDAGSHDGTLAYLDSIVRRVPFAIKVLSLPNSTRAQARNYAIEHTSCPWIAITDAGCIPHTDWLEQFARTIKLKPQAQAIAGWYSPLADSSLGEITGVLLTPDPSNLEPHYLPASRSLAITKKAYELTGGYPSHLNECEDIIFSTKLDKKVLMIRQPLALVDWMPPNTFWALYCSVRNYTSGDVKAVYWPHISRAIRTLLKTIVLVVLPVLLPVYWILVKHRFHRRMRLTLDRIVLLLMAQHVVDGAVIAGLIRGAIRMRNR